MTSLKVIDANGIITCMCSVNNILAVGSGGKELRLFDATSWEMIYSKKYEMQQYSLHLTDDLKYLTVGGNGGERCIVLNIK